MVVIDYLQVFPIPKSEARNIHSDLAADEYRIDLMKSLRIFMKNDPLLVISEARKPSSSNDAWGTSLSDIKGSGRNAFGIDAALFLIPLSPEQLVEGVENHLGSNDRASAKDAIPKGIAIRKKLADQGLSIVNLKIDKGRDGMEKGKDILMQYSFRENRFVETTWEKVADHSGGPLKDYPNTNNKGQRKPLKKEEM